MSCKRHFERFTPSRTVDRVVVGLLELVDLLVPVPLILDRVVADNIQDGPVVPLGLPVCLGLESTSVRSTNPNYTA